MIELDKTTYYKCRLTNEIEDGGAWMELLNDLLEDFEGISEDDFIEMARDEAGDWVEVQERGCGCFGGCNSCLMVGY